VQQLTKNRPIVISLFGLFLIANYFLLDQESHLVPPLAVTMAFQWKYLFWLFYANFLHMGPDHIFLNMVRILLIGVPLEIFLGARKVLALLFLGAVGCSVLQWGMNAYSSTPSLGASGIASAIVAVACFYWSKVTNGSGNSLSNEGNVTCCCRE